MREFGEVHFWMGSIKFENPSREEMINYGCIGRKILRLRRNHGEN
jgi:hypothetical protein